MRDMDKNASENKEKNSERLQWPKHGSLRRTFHIYFVMDLVVMLCRF